jgi:hypothetical protein
VRDWPHSSFHEYVRRGLLSSDWGGDFSQENGSFGERRWQTRISLALNPGYLIPRMILHD